MNYEHIKTLLEKYYRGETAQAEENELSRFLLGNSELPAEFEADRKVFAAMAQAEEFAKAPEDLNEKIMEAIDSKSPSGILSTTHRNRRWPRRLFIGISAAAVIAILTIIPFRYLNSTGSSAGESQTASNGIMDSITNMEIIPQIPNLTAETQANAEDKEVKASPHAAPTKPKLAKAKVKKTSTPQKEIEEPAELTAEEIEGLNMAALALDKASQKLAYAYGYMEESNSKISEIPQILDRILQKE